MASVWAISSVVGPTLGGVFSEFLTWNWIFFVNIPLCLLAGWLLVRNLHETVPRTPHRIDWLGGVLLTVGVSLDRKSTRLNSSHANISYAVFCLKKNSNTTI